MTETEVVINNSGQMNLGTKRAVSQAKLCDCPFFAPEELNLWHTKISSCPSVPELQFWRLMEDSGLPMPQREYRFHPIRRWRFDFAWTEQLLAVEVEGGTWQGGRHSRGAGYAQDCEKGNTALSLGWQLLRYTPGMLKDKAAVVDAVREILQRAPVGAAA